MSKTPTSTPRRRRLRRVLRAIGIVVASLIVLMVMGLALPITRNALLRGVLDRVRSSLPGELTIERADWPGLLRWELEGVGWTLDSKPVLRMEEMVVDVSPRSALQRDLVVRELRARIPFADVAALSAAFADSSEVVPAASHEPASIPYLRSGAMRGIPSVSLEQVDVAVDSLGLAPDQWAISLALTADLDLLGGHRPTAHVDAQGHDGNGRWQIRELTLALDALARQAEGHASVELAEVGVVELRLEPHGTDRVDGTLTVASLPEPVLRFLAHAVEEGSDLVGLDLEGTLVVPATRDLGGLPVLTEAMAEFPALEAARGSLQLQLRTHPDASVRAWLTLDENAWLSSLVARATARDGAVDLEQFDLHLPDLALQAAGRAGETIEATAQLEVSGPRWLAAFAPDTQLPEPLDVRVTAQAQGNPQELQLDATVRAYLANHGFALTAVAQSSPERIEAKVSRVLVHRGAESAPPTAPSRPNVVFDRGTQTLDVKDLQIEGDYGRVSAQGVWHADQPSRVTLDATWPTPPRALANALPDSARDDIIARWPSDPVPRLHFEAGLTPKGAVLAWKARARLDVPGPATFVSMLGAKARVEDLGSIAATIDGHGTTDSMTTRFSATTDLSATAWIDSAQVRIQGTPRAMDVTAGLRLLDALTFSTEGRLQNEALDFTARVDLAADSLFARLQPPVEGTNLALGGDLTLTGSTTAPRLGGHLEGSLSTPSIDVPSLVADLSYARDEMSLDLSLPAGLRTNQIQFQSLTAGAWSPLDQGAPGPIEYHVTAHGPEIDLQHQGVVTRGDVMRLESNQLQLILRGQDLSLRQPLRLTFGSEPTTVVFEQVDLQGSLGSISASGSLGKDTADVEVVVTLALPEKPAELAMPAHLWPRAIDLDLKATGPRALTGSLGVEGIAPDGKNAVKLTADASLDTALVVKLRVEDATQRYLEGDAQLAFDWDQLGAGGDPVAGRMRIELMTQNLPLPATWLGDGEPRLARLDATMSAEGTLAAPTAHAEAKVSFPDWPRVGNWIARFETDLESSPQAEVTAQWHLDRMGTNLLTGEASLPIVLQPPGLDPARAVRMSTESTTLSLREVDELLPADIGMDGSITLDFLAEGPPDDPLLQGHIVLKEAAAKLVDGSSLVADGRIDVGGRARLPELRGSLRIQQGVLVIPDTPPSLLPTDGPSMLWQAASPSDTIQVAQGVQSASTSVPMDIDVTVDIPAGLWVRGKGLEMEAAGTLQLQRAPTDSMPTITGELVAVRGRFSFLGHDFTLESGSVSFFGSALTPALNARLGTDVGSTRVRVVVAGTASKPQLKLESDPEMTEGDITSLLVFGRPLDQLNDDQLGLVRNRTNEVARSFGMAAVQNQVRQRLGVDLLQIDTGAAGEPGSVLVGKYVAPNILLKYEQVLQETTAFLVNLEYLLTRRVRVETSYGRRMPSSVEVNWTKDY